MRELLDRSSGASCCGPALVPFHKLFIVIRIVGTVGQLMDAVVDGFARRGVEAACVMSHNAVFRGAVGTDPIRARSFVDTDILAGIARVADELAPIDFGWVGSEIYVLSPAVISSKFFFLSSLT